MVLQHWTRRGSTGVKSRASTDINLGVCMCACMYALALSAERAKGTTKLDVVCTPIILALLRLT
jgi:hypothetical protein